MIETTWVSENIINLIKDDQLVVEEIPELLKILETEKFKDDGGNSLSIETRGIREPDKIYFKVDDVAIGFEIPRLNDALIHTNAHYTAGDDFKFFKIPVNYAKSKKIKTERKAYLTYTGILRVLFASRTGKASKFINWATHTLFTTIRNKRSTDKTIINHIRDSC